MGDDRELKPVEPRWCGDTRIHRAHTWIDKKKLPLISAFDPIPETVTIETEICRGLHANPRSWLPFWVDNKGSW